LNVKGRISQEDGENFILRIFMASIFHKALVKKEKVK